MSFNCRQSPARMRPIPGNLLEIVRALGPKLLGQ
jgi:hypothetical protein